MPNAFRILLALLVLASCFGCEVLPQLAEREPLAYDVVIYGSAPGAITAAVQAAKMDKTVVLINPYTHLGGMTSSGLGNTDSG
ncbi:MAG: FAD-dependent oxidoreductase, partial [Phycisphaeraceae bacterium]